MKRPAIVLGLCIGEFCAAALSVDGVVVAASYEERFHRKKCYSGFPYRSLQYLLRATGVEPGQVDLVADGEA
jgi:predicted NodU family carbamoyl transferase